MQALTKFMNWVIRLIGYAIGAVLILAVIAIAIFGFTSFGARIVTEKVASILSNRDMTITVHEPEGLLTGGLRAADITLSDTKGTFAEIRGLAINWNPLALLTGTFHARSVEIDAINLHRKPVRTLPTRPTEEGDSGFSLPVKIDVDTITLPNIAIDAPLVGRAFALAAAGSLQADNNGGELLLNVNRHDVPDAKLTADIAFTPGQNQLRLKAQLAEPKGGLVASMLGLPGNPAINIALNGDGPISDWKGKLQAALDGQQRAAIEGHHSLAPDGLHHLDIKGGGDLSALLPAAFRPLFAGQTNIDLATTFDNNGKIDIQTGNIATGSVVIAASGTLDPKGNNSLNANLLGTSGPVDFRWPLADGEARFLISGLNLALTGDAKAARLNASASLDSATLPQADIGNVKLTAKSDGFNLATSSGAIQVRLVAGDMTFSNPDLNRAVQGPVTIAASLQLSRDVIGFNGTTIESANANGSLNGSYRLSANGVTGNAKLVVQPAALPAEIGSKFNAPITIESQIAGTIPSKINLSNLSLKSGTIEAAGNIALDGDALTTDLAGRLPEIGKLLAGASGTVNYTLSTRGTLSAPALTANLKADSLHMADRTVGDLNIDLSGTADPKAPQGIISARGTIDGQQIGIHANVLSADGKTTIPALTADIGNNRLNGNLQFSSAFEPTGSLTFDLPDISLIAALAGQKAEGDLQGSVDIANDNGKIALKLLADGSGIRRDSLAIVKPTIDLAVTDLSAFAANGTVKADAINAGANSVTGLSLDIVQQQARTEFDLKAGYDNSPLLAGGSVEMAGGNIDLRLDRFSAAPRGIPVELAAPSQVMIQNGIATLNGLAIKTGTGSVTVTGSAGSTLKIDADIKDLPASLANAFVPNLDATGAISGKVGVTGTPAAPIVDFKLDWKDAATRQTKGAAIAPFGIATSGKLADNRLNFNLGVAGDAGLSVKASGNVVVAGPQPQTLDIKADILNLPAALANGFAPNLAAEGTITGKATASGSLAAPVANAELAWKNAATSQTRQAGLSALAANATATLANNKLDFDATVSGADGLALHAVGNTVLIDNAPQSVKVNGTIANVPASLANGFVPNLAAEGDISGTFTASGNLPTPSVDFKLGWKNAATNQTKAAGLSGLGLSANGTFADSKLDFDTHLTGTAGMALNAKGNLAVNGTDIRDIRVDADLANIPASLANGFVPDLAAEGTISGTATASGTLAAPTANVALAWKDAATSQTRTAGLAPLAVTANGSFADSKLDFDTHLTGTAGMALNAKGNLTVAGTEIRDLQADADLANVPASLANGFVPDLAAEGTISGTTTAAGTLAAPVANFKLAWRDAATSQTRVAKLAPLSLDATGKFAAGKLDFDAQLSGDAALKASGAVVLAGTRVQNLTVNADIASLPASLANGFLPQLGAEGIVSGTVAAAGSLPRPDVNFKLDWKDAATGQTRTAGLSNLELNATGKYSDDKLEFDANLDGDGGASLKASGSLAIAGTSISNLKVNADIANLPASLANGFMPALAAEGLISGTSVTSGTLEQPVVDFNLDWKNAATSQTKAAGLTALGVTASGKFADNRLDFETAAASGNGLSVKAKGNVTIAGPDGQSIDATADIVNVPASLANSFVPGLAAEGTITGTATASGKLPTPEADFKLEWKDAATSQTKAAGLTGIGVTASGKFLDNKLDFDVAAMSGNGVSVKATGNFIAAGPDAQTLDANATIANVPASLANSFVPGLGAQGIISGTATASGKLPMPEANFKLEWKDAATNQTKTAGLKAVAVTASGKFIDSKLDFDATAVSDNGLSIKATGNFIAAGPDAQTIDANATIANLPASLANGFVPGLAAEGVISGTATASGKLPTPEANFKLQWKNAATSQTKAAGLPPSVITANGKFTGGKLDFDVNTSGGNGLSLKATGNFIASGPDAQSLKANAVIANLPAGIANAFVPGLAAEGLISGTASASGKVPTPAADFKLNWKNAATSQTKGAGLNPLGVTANGKFADNKLTIDTTVAGDSGLSIKGGGSVVITGSRALDMRFAGNLLFAVLGPQLASQGFVMNGVANVNMQIGGTAAAPEINGTVTTSGAKFIDVRRNLALNNVTAAINLNGKQAVISKLSGQFASGGSISGSGTIRIDPAGGFPADIIVKLTRAVYVDGTLVVTTVDGTLGLKGPLLSNPTLSGDLRLDKTSITVPERLPTSLREIDIKHKHAPRAVLAQLKDNAQKKPGEKSSSITLDIKLEAPSQIFVRGRGIDAELGGNLVIKGTAAAPAVSGGFTMRRGRMTILNRRLNFSDKSKITFAGDLTPALDMEATSASGSTTLTVDVAGLATDPDITFSSSPALPQDEVLAQLIFGQSMSKLSPIQIAQLADAVSQLAGNRSTSLFEGLRNQLGVDDLDISTDEKGQTSVSVGRYINERTYFELQQGGSSGAKAIINLDVGRGVKLRGAAGGNGAGEAGIVYEREY